MALKSNPPEIIAMSVSLHWRLRQAYRVINLATARKTGFAIAQRSIQSIPIILNHANRVCLSSSLKQRQSTAAPSAATLYGGGDNCGNPGAEGEDHAAFLTSHGEPSGRVAASGGLRVVNNTRRICRAAAAQWRHEPITAG